jgi:hypothetical protein
MPSSRKQSIASDFVPSTGSKASGSNNHRASLSRLLCGLHDDHEAHDHNPFISKR